MFLDTVNKKVDVSLDTLPTTECDIVGSYADITENTFTPGSTDLTTSGTGFVTVIPAPGGGVKRQVKEVTVCNPDTDAHIASLWLNNNGTRRLVMQQTIQPGENMTYRPDALRGPQGTAGAPGTPAGATGTPADFGVSFIGKPENSQQIFIMGATRALVLPTNLTGSDFVCGVAPTADYTIDIRQNGSSIGSVVFTASTLVGTPMFTADVTINTNDILELVGQSVKDATIANIGLSFACTFG